MKLVSVAQMRAVEKEADASGLSYEKMMQNAGEGLAAMIVDEFKDEEQQLAVVGLVGPGNNGGDTLVCLQVLAAAGWSASAYLVGKRPENDPLVASLREKDVPIVAVKNDPDFEKLDGLVAESDLLLDGILGTGIKLPLREDVANVLGHVSSSKELPIVVAVDCPSGVDCDSGECALEVIPAAITFCMAAVKNGLLRFPAYAKVGRLSVVSIGLPKGLKSWDKLENGVATQAEVAEIVPPRPMTSHKGTFGTVLAAAGSINYTGAAYLAAKAAYRTGAGLVRLAVPGPLHTVLAGQLPEVTWLILPNDTGVIAESAADILLKNLDKADVLLIGPGFGMEDTTGNFIRRLLSDEPAKTTHGLIGFLGTADAKAPKRTSESTLPPMVIDADGLKLLAKIPDWAKLLPKNSVLTPHPGEMAVLTGMKIDQIQADRVETAIKFANAWKQVVVLKGALTVVAAPDQGARVIPVATAALARAGTGDVLSGIIASLIAQGVPSFEAATAGAWIHAHAGLEAEAFLEGSAAVLASDVLESIPAVFSKLKG